MRSTRPSSKRWPSSAWIWRRKLPKPITDEAVRAADVVITIGCGDDGPVYPGKRYEEWIVDDPAGQNLQAVRRIRDEIDRRVQLLVGKLTA